MAWIVAKGLRVFLAECATKLATVGTVARSPGQRGVFGAWLTRERERRYETQAEALAAYRKLGGLTISASEYAQWESGSRVPKADNPKRLALLRFYGSAPEEPPASVSEEVDLVRAIRELVDELRQTREAQTEWSAGVQDVLVALGDRVRGVPTDDPEPEIPAGARR